MLENVDLISAIITPFDDQLKINFTALERLTNHLIETGNIGFIIGGTTGETPTLTHAEKLGLYTRFAEIVAGRVPIIAGTGSNNTQATIDFTKEVRQIDGIIAALVVTPYYNKPNQRGMVAHFKAVARQTDFPIMMYNIPGRTGVQMENATIVELSQEPNIIGIKQCTNLNDIGFLVENTPNDFAVYTGNDPETLGAVALGANGVASVASHIYGYQIRALLDAVKHGDLLKAGKLQRELTPKMEALFLYPSPAPVKAVLNAQNWSVGSPRLPILPLNQKEKLNLAHQLGVNHLADVQLHY